VWHGSPHKFDKFDSSKIGTGEGAQAYGHGLYLADNPAVAQQYKEALSKYETMINGQPLTPQHPQFQAGMSIAANGYDNALINAQKQAASGFVNKDYAARQIADIEALKSAQIKQVKGGNVYKVDLPDEHIAKMLDWDKPVSESIRAGPSKTAMDQFGSGLTGTSGEHLYKEVIHNFKVAGHPNPTQAATDWLRAQGIPGIRYLDGGSRAGGAGSSNYVIFPQNEGLLKILERNGQKLP